MSDWQIDCLTDWLLTIGLLNWQKKVHETKDWEEEEEEEEDEEDEEEEEEKKKKKKKFYSEKFHSEILPTHHYSLWSWTNSSAIDNDHDGKDDGDNDVADNDDADNHADVKTLTMVTQTLTLTAMMLRGWR